MWKNYWKTGWRNILKNRLYSGINVLGLALGIGFAYLVFLYVSGELRYDMFHRHARQTYRVNETSVQPANGQVLGTSPVTPVPLRARLQEGYPEITGAARWGSFGTLVMKEGETFSETVTVADREFFDLFDFNTLKGSHNLFTSPAEMVLSEKAAHLFFGEGDPIAKTLEVKLGDTTRVFEVSAVVDNHAGESSISFDILIPFGNMEPVVGKEVYQSMNYGIIETYVMLQDEGDKALVEGKLNRRAFERDNLRGDGTAQLHTLQPLHDIHLNNSIAPGITRVGNPVYVYVLSGVGLLILFMACVNFVSLASGHTFSRAKEVGIRKTMGAMRHQVRQQLMAETLIISMLATFLGLAFVYFFFPVFTSLVASELQFSIGWGSALFLLALNAAIVVFAGGLPARLLVVLQPVQALKEGLHQVGRGIALKILVVLQFSVSLVLLIGTFIIKDQMDFIYEKDLGFDKERLFEISLNHPSSKEKAEQLARVFKTAVLPEGRVAGVTASMNDYQEPWTKLEFEQETGAPIGLYFNLVGKDYLEALKLELVSGRWFDKDAAVKGSRQLVVNEALMRLFNWDSPEGKQIPGKNFSGAHEIIGVVKDFHFSSLHDKIAPLVLALDEGAVLEGVTGLSTYRWPPMFNSVTVKISPGELQPAIKEIESVWKQANPDTPFIGHFVDQTLDAQYAYEQRWKRIIDYGSAFAFGIALLGLVGMVRLLLQRKVKEIGIRRILGSTYGGLLVYFFRGLAGFLVVANLLAWPVAWWAGTKWLQSFPYKVGMSLFPFMVSAIVVGAGVFIVVGYLTWLASLARPVDVLKNE